MATLGLSTPVFTSREIWNQERIGALALYCSDGRWGEAFDEFCHQRLLVPRYDRWAVPGGPAWLVPGRVSADLCRTTWEQLDFLVRVHQLERIVLIAHYGCAFYGELLQQDADGCLAAQVEDLRTGAAALRDWFQDMRVETYAAMRRGVFLSFHRIDA